MRPRAAVPLLAAALLAGCGGGDQAAKVQGPLGKGADQVWVFQPGGKPKALVLFFHGQGGFKEATPVYHRTWIDHLVSRGDVVLYPRYEIENAPGVLGHAVSGIRTGYAKVSPGGLPVVAIGYSRGGALAVEYAAVARREHLPVPTTVASIFPIVLGDQSRIVDLRPLDAKTRLVFFVGDRDVGGVVGTQGMLRRLQRAGFPGGRIKVSFVHSHGGFVAKHLSFLENTPAARDAFWTPLDRLVSDATS